MSGEVVFAMYRPHEGKRDALKALVDVHLPTLREYEMVTDRPTMLLEGSDGTFIEIFEWVSAASAEQVHQLPAISKIWEQMGAVGGAVVWGLIGAIVDDGDAAARGAGAGAVYGGAHGTVDGVRERHQVVGNCLSHRGYAVLN